MNPFSVLVLVNGFAPITAQETDGDCYGNFITSSAGGAEWSCSNTSIATVEYATGGENEVEGLAPGAVTVSVWWPYEQYIYDGQDCRDYGASTAATSCEVTVGPMISDISPDHGLVNSTISVSITGSGFAGGSTVSVGGSGVTASVQSSTSTSLTVNFSVAANATAGNHGVTVTSNGKTSNSVNFFVQVPPSLRRDSISGVNNQQGGCGATRTLAYHLLDQEGAEISSNDTLKETFSNYSGPPGVAPPAQITTQMASGVAIDTVGYQIPNCPPPFTATFTQTFTVVIGTQSYSLTTSNAISMGRTGSGSRFVDITISQ